MLNALLSKTCIFKQQQTADVAQPTSASFDVSLLRSRTQLVTSSLFCAEHPPSLVLGAGAWTAMVGKQPADPQWEQSKATQLSGCCPKLQV